MDPYLHAAAGRGESFRIDDIDELDAFSARGEQVADVSRRILTPPARIRRLIWHLQRRLQFEPQSQKGDE